MQGQEETGWITWSGDDECKLKREEGPLGIIKWTNEYMLHHSSPGQTAAPSVFSQRTSASAVFS